MIAGHQERVKLPSFNHTSRTNIRARKAPLLFIAFILIQLIVTLGFNHLSPELRLAGSGLAFLISIFYAFTSILLVGSTVYILSFFFLMSMVISWVLSYLISNNTSDVVEMSRNIAVGTWMLALLAYGPLLRDRFVFVIVLCTGAAAALTAILGPGMVLDSIPRFSPFTGGFEGLHSSAYSSAACIIILHRLLIRNTISKFEFILSSFIFVFLLYGYVVKSAWLTLLIYCIVYFLFKFSDLETKGVVIMLSFLAFAVIMSTILLVVPFNSLNEFSSGRIAHYFDRFHTLYNRSFSEFLFGTGAGSDAIFSTSFWWAALDSHNDFLNVLIERGLVGFLGVFAYFSALFVWGGRKGAPIVAGILASSLVSNGMLERPTELTWILLALAFSKQSLEVRFESHEARAIRRNWLRAVRGRPLGRRRSVGKGAHRPAIEPCKDSYPG